MDGHIGHLHCRFRILCQSGKASVHQTRLELVAEQRLAPAFDAALDQALLDDPTVYILRRLETRTSLSLEKSVSDERLAEQWGEALARALLRRIASGDPDLVRFANQAEYVAHFIRDLLRGTAWGHWYYAAHTAALAGASADLENLPAAEALRVTLMENRAHLPAILRELHRLGMLERTLAALNLQTLTVLWQRGAKASESDPASARLLFARALDLVDALGLWTRARPGEASLEAYLDRRPAPADWRDRRGLTAALLDILGFLSARGDLPRGVRVDNQRLEQVLRRLDWLDIPSLRNGLLALLQSTPPGDDLPVRRPGGSPTPRQSTFLGDLLAVLVKWGGQLDRRHPDSPANALRLIAWLIDHDPTWQEDPLVESMLARLLAAWAALQDADFFGGNIEAALTSLPAEKQAQARASLRFIEDMGSGGQAVINKLLGKSAGQAGLPGEQIETRCAGVALLLRAALDARLVDLQAEAPFPAGESPEPERFSALLLALALRWAGPAALNDGKIDPGLRFLCGEMDGDGQAQVTGENASRFERLDDLRSAWRQDNSGQPTTRGFASGDLAAAWLRRLAGQRLLDHNSMYLFAEPQGSGIRLIAGDASGEIWPLGALAPDARDVPALVNTWLTSWTEAFGRPEQIVAAESLEVALAGLGGLQMIQPGQEGEAAEGYARCQERLHNSLAALEGESLGSPSTDLALDLMALTLVRSWSRWLRHFSDSGAPYLLGNFIRRPGQLIVTDEKILALLEPRPLDLVLDMAGYLAPLNSVKWLAGRHIEFVIRGA